MVGEKLLMYKAERLARKKAERTCSISYENAINIGIIFTVEDIKKHSDVKAFVKKLSGDNKKVEVLSYLPKGTENHEFTFNFFTNKDISFWGNHVNEEVLSFINKKFDYIFCLDCNPQPLVLSILAATKAGCRVGCHQPDKKYYYELMIQPQENNTENLTREIFKYIKILR